MPNAFQRIRRCEQNGCANRRFGKSRKKVHSQYQEHIAAIMQVKGVSFDEARRIYSELYEQDKELDPKVLVHAPKIRPAIQN